MKPKPWRTGAGALVGFLVGLALWWSAYEPAEGLFQNVRLILLSAASGMAIVLLRNRWKKVGAWDPETVAQNRRGRL